MEATTEEVKAMLRVVVGCLVDEPEAVEISAVEGRQSTILEVGCAPRDVRRVIGRKGRTADALREILHNVASKAKHSYRLEILEPEQRHSEVEPAPLS